MAIQPPKLTVSMRTIIVSLSNIRRREKDRQRLRGEAHVVRPLSIFD